MKTDFEKQKNRKALTYTAGICGGLLLLFILISWKVMPVAQPVIPDLIELNLGNFNEGYGEEQPLIKGERSPDEDVPEQPKQALAKQQDVPEESVTPDDNAEEDAAPVTKVEKKIPKVKAPINPSPVPTPVAKPQKPKLVYNGPGKGGGNNSTEDNGYRMQGNNANGKGDAGDPSGNKDSYGNSPGGRVGGPRVISGNRRVVGSYSFKGELAKATINAIVNISASGTGTFVKIAQGSTSFNRAYADAIISYLRQMKFNASADESQVTVQFNFVVN